MIEFLKRLFGIGRKNEKGDVGFNDPFMSDIEVRRREDGTTHVKRRKPTTKEQERLSQPYVPPYPYDPPGHYVDHGVKHSNDAPSTTDSSSSGSIGGDGGGSAGGAM